jgi:multidrug efflux system outer membrane protein
MSRARHDPGPLVPRRASPDRAPGPVGSPCRAVSPGSVHGRASRGRTASTRPARSTTAIVRRSRLAAWCWVLGLAGCAVYEPPLRPTLALPAAWSEAPAESGATVDPQWWRGFGSQQLAGLVDEGMAGSGDLRIAAERVRQAEIALALAGAARLPVVGGSAGATAGRTESSDTPSSQRESTRVGLSISYEVDLWGRLAAAQRAGEATLRATRFDLDGVRLSLSAGIASAYFQWIALGERLTIARGNLATAERVLALVEARRRNGVATALEVSQQRTTVLTLRTAIIPLELQRRQTASALALLLGRMPQSAELADEPLAGLALPTVAPGLPSTLLYRRPDLASTEAQLAAADADVAAARAALLPSFSLSVAGGLSSATLLGLANPVSTATLALSLAQSLFDGGQRRLQVDLSRSQRVALVEGYGNAVRTALKEVDDALGNVDRGARQEAAQQAVIDQASESLRLAELRYREGSGDLLSVLDAQRVLFIAQDALVGSRLTRLTSAVDLFKALGGGWNLEVAAGAAGRGA